MRKCALISGITGQDGAYLANFLIKKGYEVHGIIRRTSLPKTDRIQDLLDNASHASAKITLHEGDLLDNGSLIKIVQTVQPDELYNLAAMSDVAISFETPEYTAQVDGLGTLRFLEAIIFNRLEKKTRFYQASTSELFGKVQEVPQNESTPFYPRSPYAIAKLYAYWTTVNYREAYGLYACNGILFNHESPLRGENFVTRKITKSLARIALGQQDCLYLGNLDSKRDWGHAKDYVEMQWLMLQQEKPEDYVIATGRQYTVREFATFAANELGIEISWKDRGASEVGIVSKIRKDGLSIKEGQMIIGVDPKFYRPSEVDNLIGDASKAKAKLGWTPKISFKELVQEMICADFDTAKKACFKLEETASNIL